MSSNKPPDVSKRKKAGKSCTALHGVDGRVSPGEALTESKNAMEALRESEERFRALVEPWAQAVWETDANGRAVADSPSWRAYTGQTLEEGRGNGWVDAVHPDDRGYVERQRREAVASGRALDIEYRFKGPDGGWRWTNARAAPVRASDGSILKWVGMNIDITARKRAEEALRTSEHRLRLAMSIPGMIVTEVDPDLRITWVHNAGPYFPLSLALGRRDDEINPTEDGRRLVELKRWALREGRPQRAGWSSEGPGGRRHYDLYMYPGRNERGEITGLTTMAIDVTERRKAEEAFRQSQELLLAVMEGVPDPIFVKNRESAMLMVNPANLHLLGKPREEVIGKTPRELHKDQALADVILSNDRKVMESGQSCVVEELVPTAHGVRTFLARKTPYRDGNGEIVGILGIAMDITERKEAERRLRESEERFRIMADSSPLMVWVTDEKGRDQFVNRAYREFFGVANDQASGMDWTSLVHHEDREGYVRSVSAAILGKKPFHGSARVKRADGEWRWIESFGAPRFSHDELYLGHVGSNIDITERKQAEEELGMYRAHLEKMVRVRTVELEVMNRELMEEMAARENAERDKRETEARLAQVQRFDSLARLAGGIAHDLNNSLAPILFNLETLLEEEPAGSPRRDILDESLKAACRQKDLLGSILSFRGRDGHGVRPVRLGPLLEETMVFLRSMFPATVEISHRIAAKRDVVVCDPVQIQQVVMNLCENAVEALAGGKGRIEVKLVNVRLKAAHGREPVEPGEYLRLTVKDDGPGMSPGVKKRIFEPFFTAAGEGTATGMGLAIAQGIIRSHGGTIAVESEEKKGALFKVYLPVSDAACPEQAPAAGKALSGRSGEMILLVDDEEILLSSMQRTLIRAGYRVTASRSSIEALALFTINPEEYDLVITDLTMPGMTGVELADRLLGIRPTLPVILCTGYNDAVTPQETALKGIRQLILKPVGSGELKKIVRNALES